MKAAYLSVIIFSLLLTACGNENTDSLSVKKEKLSQLKTQLSELTAQVAKLESEISLEDTTLARRKKTKIIRTDTLIPQTFQHYVELQGSVDAKNNINVTPKSPGLITAVYVKEGDQVTAGRALIKIDDSIQRENIEEIKTQLTLAQTVFEKQERLWSQKIGTEIQFLQAKNNKESLEKRLATLNTQLNQSVVTSPINGTVDRVSVKIGEMASPGVPLMNIVNLGNLKITAKVSDSYAASVKKGDDILVNFPDLNREYKLKISFVSTSVDPLTRTFTIEANLPSEHGLKPNMMAQLKINDLRQNDALVIDQNLIQNTENGQVVYIVEENNGEKVARAKYVKTGPSYNGKIVILDGLEKNDQLITFGYQEIADGESVGF